MNDKTQKDNGTAYHNIVHTNKLNAVGIEMTTGFYRIKPNHPNYPALVELHNYESIHCNPKKESLVTLNGEHTGYWMAQIPNNGGVVEYFLGYSTNSIVRKWHSTPSSIK